MFAKKKPVINTSSRSYLQPQSLKVHQLVQSPKFNIEKALQEQIQRKRINQQKLARYDHYNSILAAKGIQGCNQNKKQQRSQLKMQSPPPALITASPKANKKNLTRGTFPNSNQKSQLNKPNPSPIQSQFQIQQQKYLQLLREKNQNLHTKNDELKVYLKEVNSGVGQLKGILQEVEGNYDKLKGMYPLGKRESGLWLNQDGENSYEQGDEQSIQLQSQLVQYRNDIKAINPINKYLPTSTQYKQSNQQPQLPSTTILPSREQYQSQTNLGLLDEIETKFKGILRKVSEHKEEKELLSKKDSPIYQFNKIERQLDKIKSVQKVNNNKKPVLSYVQSQKNNLQYTNSYLSPSNPSQPYTKLIKSKSSKLFFS